MFPTIKICVPQVAYSREARGLVWGKIDEVTGSIVVYNAKPEFWNSTVIPTLREHYPEIIVHDGKNERQILTIVVCKLGTPPGRYWHVLARRLGVYLHDAQFRVTPPQD